MNAEEGGDVSIVAGAAEGCMGGEDEQTPHTMVDMDVELAFSR